MTPATCRYFRRLHFRNRFREIRINCATVFCCYVEPDVVMRESDWLTENLKYRRKQTQTEKTTDEKS